jgi:hypothetical protein
MRVRGRSVEWPLFPLAAPHDRNRYRPQVAAVLQRLADALDGIEAGGGRGGAAAARAGQMAGSQFS